MSLYVTDDRYMAEGYTEGYNTPLVGGEKGNILWKIKDNQCGTPIVNEYWYDKNKNYSICATRSNGLIVPITDKLKPAPVLLCSDNYGNLYSYASIEKTIQKIDINNKISTIFNFPDYLDSGNNVDVGGFANGKPYNTTAFTSINGLAADNNENIYVTLEGSQAIYKIKDKKISKLCGQPSDTFLGPNENKSRYNAINPPDGSKDQVIFGDLSNLKFFNNYLYVLDQSKFYLRRIDLQGNVKTISTEVQLVDYVITKDNYLYTSILGQNKLKKINLKELESMKLNPQDASRVLDKDKNNIDLKIDFANPRTMPELIGYTANFVLDDKEENLFIAGGGKFAYNQDVSIKKINLYTDLANPIVKVIAFAGEDSVKREGGIRPGQGKDIETQDFKKNIQMAYRIDKPEITSVLNIQGEYNKSFFYRIVAEGLPQKYFLVGTLPEGLIFNNSTGMITGKPLACGRFSVIIRVEKTSEKTGIKSFDSKELEITISPSITSELTVVSAFNELLNYTIAINGNANYFDAEIVSGSTRLPISNLGLNIDHQIGQITGTLNSGGIFDIEISASIDDIKIKKILKLSSLKITSPQYVSANRNSYFYYPFQVLGEPDSFEVLGNIPNNLVFYNGLTKSIAGIMLENSGQILPAILLKINKGSASYTQSLIISIGTKILNTELEKNLRHGEIFQYQINVDEDNLNNLEVSVSNLPTGLSFDSNSLLISGSVSNKNINGLFECIISVTKNSIVSTKKLLIKIPPSIEYDGRRIELPIDKFFEYKIDCPGANKFLGFDLPEGFKIDQTTGIISGSASSAGIGEYFSEISASNEGGASSIKILFYIGPNFIVKQDHKSERNIYFKKGDKNTFIVNNKEAPTLYIEKNKTYIFDQSDFSNKNDRLNIYLDLNKKTLLNKKYIKSYGVEGVNRTLELTLPKSSEIKTLYYLSETKEYCGGEIKVITKNYKLKYNIKLLIFGARHDGEKYVLPNKMIDESFILKNLNSSYTQMDNGILAILSSPIDDAQKSINKIHLRKDVLTINLINKKEVVETEKFIIDYFGNNLIYSQENNNVQENNWSNLKNLYEKINEISFRTSGFLDNNMPSGGLQSYKDIGYKLSYCPGCVTKTNLITGENNLYSGQIEIYYDPIKILNNKSDIFLTETGNLKNENFILSESTSVIYEKFFEEMDLGT